MALTSGARKPKMIVGKVVVIGKQAVGKTSIINRYVVGVFDSGITATIGASFQACRVKVEDVAVKLEIWDTAGQERFRSMAPMFYRKAHAALMVFDLTSRSSFEDLKSWVEELQKIVKEPMVLCVVGNKNDLVEKREVCRAEALEFADGIGAGYFETSALVNANLDKVFETIATGLIELSGNDSVATIQKFYDEDDPTSIMRPRLRNNDPTGEEFNRVVLSGNDVGKTSMIVRYVENNFNPYITPTIGASFFTCKVKLEEIVVKLQIWDTAGQERFKAMAPMFYRNANAAMLVFDITDPESFEDMKKWVTELKRNVEEPMFLCVVGNKIDLISKRQVCRDEAIQYSNSIGASYYESSALTNQGLEHIFYNTAVGLVRLSGEDLVTTLKIYSDEDDLNSLMARSSELNATDVGTVETVNLGINSIAHGNSVSSKCC